MKNAFSVIAMLVCLTAYAESFDVNLKENPAIHLRFDRKYEVMKIGKKDAPPVVGQYMYAMLPEDQRSSIVLTVGDGFKVMTAESIEKERHTKVTRVDGSLGPFKVQWWHYRDASAPTLLCSSCVATVPFPKDKTLQLAIELMASTPERLASLEESFSKMELAESQPNQSAHSTPALGQRE